MTSFTGDQTAESEAMRAVINKLHEMDADINSATAERYIGKWVDAVTYLTEIRHHQMPPQRLDLVTPRCRPYHHCSRFQEFHLMTDASKAGMGYVLQQRVDGHFKPEVPYF